jgi:RNA polymerase sigma factor (sigma-70 family)
MGSDAAEAVDLLDLDAALNRLALASDRQARIVELRFFGGLSLPEIARVLEASQRTIEREWRFARAWLHDALSG